MFGIKVAWYTHTSALVLSFVFLIAPSLDHLVTRDGDGLPLHFFYHNGALRV